MNVFGIGTNLLSSLSDVSDKTIPVKNSLSLYTDSNIKLDTTGRVGIGISIPTTPLEIQSVGPDGMPYDVLAITNAADPLGPDSTENTEINIIFKGNAMAMSSPSVIGRVGVGIGKSVGDYEYLSLGLRANGPPGYENDATVIEVARFTHAGAIINGQILCSEIVSTNDGTNKWDLGKSDTTTGLILNTTQYVNVTLDGTAYKLALVQ